MGTMHHSNEERILELEREVERLKRQLKKLCKDLGMTHTLDDDGDSGGGPGSESSPP